MGGLVCHNIVAAILEFDCIPSDQKKLPVFDKQLRQVFAHPVIATDLDAITPNPLPQAISILSKPSWTLTDRID
jgi:energy-converting hydrogenase Eha subunit A